MAVNIVFLCDLLIYMTSMMSEELHIVWRLNVQSSTKLLSSALISTHLLVLYK